MDTREFAGLELAARAAIKRTGAFWLVPSLSHKGSQRVNGDATECSCEDFELHGTPCKHIQAVRIVKERDRTPLPTRVPLVADPAVKPKRKTYKQDWPAYNKAQTNEKRLFLGLLADLCAVLPERERKPGPGRKPLSFRDGVFAATFKVYSGFSGRRFTTDMVAARDSGFVDTAPHYNSMFRVLEDADTTPHLHRLIIRSSLPLKAVETTFAVDSSGFSTSRFGRWFDAKYGIERRRAEFVKTHIAVGVNTQVVTAVEISDRHDGQAFPGLVATTGQNFTLRDICADKAYLSAANLEFVEGEGGSPMIPFKSRTRPDLNGATWERLYHYFHLNRAEFLPRYHQRSNIESAFSMMKRKFGDGLRSKTDVALTNEVLCKILCHNLVVLIHEMHELGIDPGFGGRTTAEEEEPRLLRFPGA